MHLLAMEISFTNSPCQHAKAVIEGRNLQHLLWSSMLNEPLMFQVNLSVVGKVHL